VGFLHGGFGMRKIVCLLTALLLLAMLPFGVFADVDIQAMVNELPTVEEIQLMELEEQQKAYLQVQEVYEIYMGLGEDRLKIVGGEEKFDQLFSWFNMQVMPLEQEPEEPEQDPLSNVVSTALALIPVVLLMRYFEKKKVR
jgi:hypothetical protein